MYGTTIIKKLKDIYSVNDKIIQKLIHYHLQNPKMISYHKTDVPMFMTDKIYLHIDSYYMVHFTGSYEYKEQIIFLKNNEMLSRCNYKYKDDMYNYIHSVKIITNSYKFIKKYPFLPVEPFQVNFQNKLK